MIREYACSRAALLASPTANGELAELDKGFLSQCRAFLAKVKDSAFFSVVVRHAMETQQEEHFVNFSRTTAQLAFKLGVAQAERKTRTDEVSSLRHELRRYVTRQLAMFGNDSAIAKNISAVMRRSEDRGIAAALDAESRAIDIFRGTHPRRKNHDAVCIALGDTEREQRDLIRRACTLRYNHSLKTDIRKAFKGLPRKEAEHLLDGKVHAAQADRFCRALHSYGYHRAARVVTVLDSIPPQEFSQFAQEYSKRHAPRMGDESVDKITARLVHPALGEYIRALLNEEVPLARAIRAHLYFEVGSFITATPRTLEFCRFLEVLSREERTSLGEAFATHFGRTLASYCDMKIKSAPLRDWARALISGTELEQDVTKIRAGLHSRGVWVGEAALFKGRHHLEAVRNAYDWRYGYEGKFWDDLRRATYGPNGRWLKALIGDEHTFLRELFTNGKASPSKIAANCMLGLGTDVPGLAKVFEELTLKRRRVLRRQFKAETGQSLVRMLHAETSGDDRFDLFQMLRCKPAGAQAIQSRLVTRYRYENQGLWTHICRQVTGWRGLLARATRDSRCEISIMDRDFRAASEYFEQSIRERTPSQATRLQYGILADRAFLSCDAFRKAKNYVCELLTELSSKAVGVASCCSTFLVLERWFEMSGWVSVPSAALAGFISTLAIRLSLKRTLKGRIAYGFEEEMRDGLRSLLDGGTTFVGRGAMSSIFGRFVPLPKEIMGRAMRFVARNVVERVVSYPDLFARRSRTAHRSRELIEEYRAEKLGDSHYRTLRGEISSSYDAGYGSISRLCDL